MLPSLSINSSKRREALPYSGDDMLPGLLTSVYSHFLSTQRDTRFPASYDP